MRSALRRLDFADDGAALFVE
ncbi:MAG: hypothetical protein RL398_1419, partial [Planctomycetota bacterium]